MARGSGELDPQTWTMQGAEWGVACRDTVPNSAVANQGTWKLSQRQAKGNLKEEEVTAPVTRLADRAAQAETASQLPVPCQQQTRDAARDVFTLAPSTCSACYCKKGRAACRSLCLLSSGVGRPAATGERRATGRRGQPPLSSRRDSPLLARAPTRTNSSPSAPPSSSAAAPLLLPC